MAVGIVHCCYMRAVHIGTLGTGHWREVGTNLYIVGTLLQVTAGIVSKYRSLVQRYRGEAGTFLYIWYRGTEVQRYREGGWYLPSLQAAAAACPTQHHTVSLYHVSTRK